MIYVILVNWNSWRDTQECILSLSKMVGLEFKVIVCDNNSSDDSIQRLESLCSNVPDGLLRIVNTGGNLGFAGGNNVGINIALADPETSHIWLLNNDTTVDSDALSRLLEKMRDDERIGICGSTLLFAHDPQVIQAVGGKYNSWLGLSAHILGGVTYSAEQCEQVNPDEFDYVVGASMLVSRNFIEKVGLMDEQYFLYCEELDWATRAKRAGFKLGYAPSSLVYHKEGGTTGSASHIKRKNRSVFADRCAQRSCLLYAKKHFPNKKWFVVLFFVVKATKRLLQGDFLGALVVIKSALSGLKSFYA